MAGVLNQTPLDWSGNRRNIISAIREAREQEATVLCLPELCITGYGCEDAFHSPGIQRTAQEVLLELLPETTGMIVSLGLPLMHRGGLFNVACLAVDGEILGLVAKQNLAGDGLHYEPRWFKPWPNDVYGETRIAGKDYPIGDLMFDVGDVVYGFEICEDAWVANRPGADLARRGADVILNPSASHFAFGKQEIRKRFVLEGSRAFSVSYIYANLLGNEAGRAIYDGDAMIAASGKMLAVGPRFSFADWSLTSAVVDVEKTRMMRARTGSYRPWIEAGDEGLVRADFAYPLTGFELPEVQRPSWESSPQIKCEEFSRAVSLALFDYLRKSRSRGFVVSLSGGADSAAVASLTRLMIDLAVEGVGRDAFEGKLPLPRRLE